VQAASAETEAVEVFGKTAYQWGTYKQTVVTKSKAAVAPHPAEYRGRYVASWRREPDGHWRLARMLVQPFPPAAAQ
jgi:ketosteroid isomerase-like protein